MCQEPRTRLHAHPTEGSDAEIKLALDNLSRKYTELADVVAQYMSEAGLERNRRVGSAMELAVAIERIVGGKPVPPGGFPECCLIGRRFANGSEQWFCTGVLVHPRVVLTAAHCSPPGTTINLVALQAENMAKLGEADIVGVRRTVVHPGYPQTGLNDIAVLLLRKDAVVPPVPLATTQDVANATRTTLVGFGNDDILSTRGFGIKREVEVDITYVRRSPQDNLDEAEQLLGFESDLEFIAGGLGFDSCNGDSGGPAYIQVDGERKVAGLTSRGVQGAVNPCGEGGIYTRVDTQRTFIRGVMKAAGIEPLP